MQVIEGIFWISLSIYGSSLILFSLGNMFPSKVHRLSHNPSVSVIVAVRDGNGALPGLLEALSAQVYSGEVEFIIVDDMSSDDTADIIAAGSHSDSRIKAVSSTAGESGLKYKKRALDAGIRASSGEILLFTDVDCRMGPNWVAAMAACFAESVDFVIGYSAALPGRSLTSRFQSLDFYQLLTAARGITSLGSPWASTGQNQGYRRSVYEQAGGFTTLADCLQGDDSLFLQSLRSRFNIKAVFADDPASHIQGRTEMRWRSLIRQRTRWSGDATLMWKYNPLFFLMIVATFFVNSTLLVFLLLLIFTGTGAIPLFSGVILKFALELMLNLTGRKHFITKLDFVDFLFWYFVQIPYVTLMGIAGFMAPRLGWEERN